MELRARLVGWTLTFMLAILCGIVSPALGCSTRDSSPAPQDTNQARASRPDQGHKVSRGGALPVTREPSPRALLPDLGAPRATAAPPDPPERDPSRAHTSPPSREDPDPSERPHAARRHGKGFAPPLEEPAGEFGLILMGVGTGIEDRELVGSADVFTTDDERVFGWVAVRNMRESARVVMVWSRGDDEMFRIPLRIGVSPRWRTWSVQRVNLRRYIGVWRLDILDTTGHLLGTKTFEVRASG